MTIGFGKMMLSCGSFSTSSQHLLIVFGSCLSHGSNVVTNVSGILDLSVCF